MKYRKCFDEKMKRDFCLLSKIETINLEIRDIIKKEYERRKKKNILINNKILYMKKLKNKLMKHLKS